MTQEQQFSSTGTGASGRAQLFLSDPGELVNLVVRHLFQSQTGSAAMAQTCRRALQIFLLQLKFASKAVPVPVSVSVEISQQPFQSVFTMADLLQLVV